MKIEMFDTLDAVLRGGSLAAAASETNLTASAVSMQMKQLEGYLGQPLFDRSGHAIRPTPLAHEVAAAMRQGLQHLQSLRRRSVVAVEGVVRLGIIESMMPMLLPGTLSELRDRYPQLELRPTRGRSIGLTDAVKSGELDAAVVAEPEGGGSVRLNWRTMLRSEMRLIAPPRQPPRCRCRPCSSSTSGSATTARPSPARWPRAMWHGRSAPGAARWNSTACPPSSRW